MKTNKNFNPTKSLLKKLLGRNRTSDPTQDCINETIEKQPLSDTCTPQHESDEGQESGYGWVVVLASFMVHITVYGVTWSVGVFFVIFLELFQESKTATSWAGSLLNATMLGSGLVASCLVRRHGCRCVALTGALVATAGLILSSLSQNLYQLYFSFSLLTGLGLGLAYIPSVVIVSEYFVRRRTLALGMAVSGVGMGGFIYPAVIGWLIQEMSWRYTMLVVAAIVMVTLCVFGAAMKPAPSASPQTMSDAYVSADWRLWLSFLRTPAFLVLCINNLFYCLGLVVVYVHLGAFAGASSLLNTAHAAQISSIVGLCNLFGRMLHGVVCHYFHMNCVMVYCVSSIISGLATILIPFSGCFSVMVVCAGMFGLFSACFGALLPDIIIRLLGRQHLGAGYGVLLLFESAGSVLGGPLAGALYDATLVYDYSFFMAGTLLVVSGLVMVHPYYHIRQSERSKRQHDQLYNEKAQEKHSCRV